LRPNTKAYRLFNLVTQKLLIFWDVNFDEAHGWNWDTESQECSPPINLVEPGENPYSILTKSEEEQHDDSEPRRMTLSIEEIYQSSQISLCCEAPTSFEEVIKKMEWAVAMEEEIKMIEKNKTLEHV